MEKIMIQPLKGIRILDLTRLLPGPFLTQLLTDLGAEVIKVETPTAGDYARHAPPEMKLGGLFEMINQGKKSIAINYRNPRGREALLKLTATADVVIESFRPGGAARFKIDYDSLRAAKPDLIYCALSGYGQEGPYSRRAGHDLNYSAISGALSLNAREGGAPIPFGVTIADLSGAMMAGLAILGALVGRQSSGTGAYLDVALLDGVFSLMMPLAGAAYFKGLPVGAGMLALQGGLACYNLYETSDGKHLSLGALEPTFWTDFCNVTGRSDLISRQFDTSIKGEVAGIFKTRSLADWLEAFAASDGCVEPVLSFEEALQNPQIKARGYVREENGRAVGLNSPFVFAQGGQRSTPGWGEHTFDLLGEVLNAQELEELKNDGIIGLRKNRNPRVSVK
jgi:crotonobetainyl-CoA:carnitine CoA-transferase CaiB-like acyl-CoA transferase